MMELSNIKRVYFIGIGGIGMSALAKYFLSKETIVSGYDKTQTPFTIQLENEGMNIHYNDNIDLLDKEAELVIYTPAVPADHAELNYYRDNNYQVVKRSDVLGEIVNSSFNICIAGTHGKTTISTMIAHILHDSGYGCNAFLGGISVNYETNFLSSDKNIFVAEADEYDRSFLKLTPDVAVISAMDADHLDIYGTEEAMQTAFVNFSKKVKPEGLLISKYGLQKTKELVADNKITYSLQNDMADAYATNIVMKHGGYVFNVMTKDWMIDNITLNMGGMHNVENAVAAIVVAHHLKIENSKIRKSVENFKGVKRRFEYIIKKDSLVFIDDYAHHPEELRALISGAKSLFREMKCTVVFQPHLFSRTRDLAEGFAESLDLADEVILLPIYPARELPVEGISSEMILNKMKNENKSIKTKDQLLDYIGSFKVSSTGGDLEGAGSLFITAGAGDIDQLVQPLKEILNKK